MGVPDGSIRVTGNTVVDALLDVSSRLPAHAPSGWPEIPGDKRLILVTAHRRESFGRPLENICMALREIAAACRPELHIVYPVHLNPNVQEPVHRLLGRDPSISLLPPLDYVSLIWLMKHCYVVLTDSGGIQEEAPSLGKPVLILRDVTERPEAIEAGTARLVGTDVGSIVAETLRLVRDRRAYESMARVTNPFGDGHAAERIVAALLPGQNREPS
jgi:UDP-N-acetylglucosamine 2-epimerase (non-hydrolysing)